MPAEMHDRYGEPPEPVANLLAVARFRLGARAGLTEVSLQGHHVGSPRGPARLEQLRLKRLYPDSVFKPPSAPVVPRPTTARVGGEPLRDLAVLRWAEEVVESVLGGTVAAAASVALAAH